MTEQAAVSSLNAEGKWNEMRRGVVMQLMLE